MKKLFIILLLLFPAVASANIFDSFDTYSLGVDLEGRGSWATTSVNYATVSNDVYSSSPYSGYFNNDHARLFSTSSAYSGYVEFDLYVSSCDSSGNFVVPSRDYGSVSITAYSLDNDEGQDCYILNKNNVAIGAVATSTWYTVKIVWDGLTDMTDFYLDDQLLDSTSTLAAIDSGVEEIIFIDPASVYYIDDITFYISESEDYYCSGFTTEVACSAAGCVWWFDEDLYNAGHGLFIYQGCAAVGSVLPEYESPLDPYPDQAACEAAGYYWVEGSGCYATSTEFQVDMNLFDRFWDIVKDPEGFFDDLFEHFDFRQKPPFSWVIGIYSVITQQLADYDELESDTSAFGTTTIPFAGMGTISFRYIDFSWLNTTYASQFSTFRSIMGFVVWLWFVIYIYQRSRRFADSLNS